MQPAQRKHARAEPSLPALPDDPLERIFARVIDEEDGLRAMRLLHAALKETSSGQPQPRVEICGLAASASLFRALQTAPAGAPAGAAAPTLGELLQRAAGGWMLQSDNAVANPPGPSWQQHTVPPGITRYNYGRGAPMDGRGACTDVAELHRQLLRGCVDFGVVNKQWYRAWQTSNTGKMCKELIATLTAVGRQVRAQEPPPREMPEELSQRAYNTQYGPDHADRGANDLADAARDAEIEQLQAALESAEFQQTYTTPRAQNETWERQRLTALFKDAKAARRHKTLPPETALPALLPAYEAKPDGENRRSDSYVGLFALVQLAAAAAVDLILLNRARTTMRTFVQQLTDAQKATHIHTREGLQVLQAHYLAGGPGEPQVQQHIDGTVVLYFDTLFQRGTVYRASVEAGHGRADYVAVRTSKQATVHMTVREGLTVEQMLQQLESESGVTGWHMRQYTVYNPHDQAAHETPNIALCPTVEYRPQTDDLEALMEPGAEAAVVLADMTAPEWVVGADYHYGPGRIAAEKKTTPQNEPATAAPVALAATENKTSLSLMHYLPPPFAPALSLQDLLGGLQN
jgi:hypothetical protein